MIQIGVVHERLRAWQISTSALADEYAHDRLAQRQRWLITVWKAQTVDATQANSAPRRILALGFADTHKLVHGCAGHHRQRRHCAHQVVAAWPAGEGVAARDASPGPSGVRRDQIGVIQLSERG